MKPVKLVAELINLGANAKLIMENELKKAPKVDPARHDRFWKTMISIIADESKAERRLELTIEQANVIDEVLGEEEVCRKVSSISPSPYICGADLLLRYTSNMC